MMQVVNKCLFPFTPFPLIKPIIILPTIVLLHELCEYLKTEVLILYYYQFRRQPGHLDHNQNYVDFTKMTKDHRVDRYKVLA